MNVGRQVHAVSYNVRHGWGMDDVVDVTRQADVLARLQPDILFLQEIDRGAERTHGEDQLEIFSRMLGMEGRFARFMEFQGGEYGLALVSKYPILRHQSISLPPGSIEPRTALAVQLQLPFLSLPMQCVCVHLSFEPGEDDVRKAQVQTLLDYLAQTPGPAMIGGDFNGVLESPAIQLLRGHFHLPPKSPPSSTYPADQPTCEIDHIAWCGLDEFASTSYAVIPESVASDHRPVLLTLASPA